MPQATSPTVSTTLSSRVRAIIERAGLAAAARELGVAREALARVAGGLRVRRGTIALIEQALERAERDAR